MSSAHFRRWPAQGLTLIELLAAIVLITVLLAGVLTAWSQHARQIETARTRVTAAQIADDLLYDWLQEGHVVPRSGHGRVGESTWLSWKTQIADQRYRNRWGIDIVRLTILDRSAKGRPSEVLAVDIAVPADDWPPETIQP